MRKLVAIYFRKKILCKNKPSYRVVKCPQLSEREGKIEIIIQKKSCFKNKPFFEAALLRRNFF
ncbi:hypothetical protein EFY79_04375 [Hanamia caeni]|jgi:hypothetical protein|uniref:Uncharacterized protein n=1 Tax=Hanamia caeni TaxID=2294116 RepID=A0A3M9NM86_9BACT|nr:hypothetical protein EFY79_04375 [Hanamia caeni]